MQKFPPKVYRRIEKTNVAIDLSEKSYKEIEAFIRQYRKETIDLSASSLKPDKILLLLRLLTSHPTISRAKLPDLSSLKVEYVPKLRKEIRKNKTLSQLEIPGRPNQAIVHALVMGSIEANVHCEINVDTSLCSPTYRQKIVKFSQQIKAIKSTGKQIARNNYTYNNKLPITYLPNELLLHILNFLPSRAIGRISLTSSLFYQITRDEQLWRTRCLEFPLTLRTCFIESRKNWFEYFCLLYNFEIKQIHYTRIFFKEITRHTREFLKETARHTGGFLKEIRRHELDVLFTKYGTVDWHATYTQLKFPGQDEQAQKQKNRYLMEAVDCNCVLISHYLLKNNANPNSSDLLDRALRNYRIECIELVNLLLENGAMVDGDDLEVAARRGYSKCLKLLLQHDANPNISSISNTPLHRAAEYGRATCVTLLLEAKANTESKNNSVKTPLHYAAKYGHAACARLLLQHGAKQPGSALLTAVNCYRTQCAAAVLPFVNNADDISAALFQSVRWGNSIDCVKLLLSYGADPLFQPDGEHGDSALSLSWIKPEIKSLLLRAIISQQGANDSTISEAVNFAITFVRPHRKKYIDLSTFPLHDWSVSLLPHLLINHPTISSAKLGDLNNLTERSILSIRKVLSQNKTLSQLKIGVPPHQDMVHSLLMGSIEANIHCEILVDTSRCSPAYQRLATEVNQNIKAIKVAEKRISQKNTSYNNTQPIHNWLPTEVLLHIFSYLPPRELAKMGLVNSVFYPLSRDEILWKHICLYRYSTLNTWFPKSWEETWLERGKRLPLLQFNEQEQVENTRDFFCEIGPNFFSVRFSTAMQPNWASTFAQLRFSKKSPAGKNEILFQAALCHSIPMVYFALENGANPNIQNMQNTPLLYLMVESGDIVCTRFLLRYRALIDVVNSKEETALYFSAKEGASGFVKLLLKHDANPNKPDKFGKTPLYQAVYNGHTPCAKLLLQYGALVDQCCGENEFTPLIIAAREGKSDCVRLLLEYGADSNRQTSQGASALYAAAFSGCTQSVELLLPYTINLNTQSSNGSSALHLAAEVGHAPIVKLLLEHGANPNLKTDKGKTPLKLAKKREIKKLLRHAMKEPQPTTNRSIASRLNLGFIMIRTHQSRNEEEENKNDNQCVLQ